MPSVQDWPLHRFTLPNGLRVAWIETRSPVASAGVMVDAGTVNESPDFPAGIAHFTEHMLFKGTQKRKAHHILTRMDDVGGDLNAYTTKEQTFYYATFLQPHTYRALELLADMVIRPSFPEKEMDKEKAVVLDEIQSSKDDAPDELGEWFDAELFAGHPLSIPILGEEQALNRLTRKDLLDWHGRCYTAENMVLVLVGRFQRKILERWVYGLFSEVPSGAKAPLPRPEKPLAVAAFQRREFRSNHSAYGILGGLGPDVLSEQRLPVSVLNNILGGPAMSSRLNMGIREKYGITYLLESNYTPYRMSGSWSVLWATEPAKMQRTRSLILKELQRLAKQPLGSMQWHKAIQQIMGQLALSNENAGNLLHIVARSILLHDEVETLATIFDRLQALTPTHIVETAELLFADNQRSECYYYPDKN